jgi:amino acid adenylation domain-containing protein
VGALDGPANGQCCLHHLIEAQVQRTPELPAVAFEGDTLNYRQLDERAGALAASLRDLGVGPDAIVGLFVERSIDAVVGLLGVLKAGGAYLPIDAGTPPDRVALMLEDANVTVLLTQTPLRAQAPEGRARVICLDTVDWTAAGSEDPASTNPGADAMVRPDHLAYVIYTSGSTGRPKGVCIEHRNIVAYTRAVSERLRLEPGWHYATVSTMAADLGHTVLFPSLATGGCLHLVASARAESPARLREYFDRERIDVLKIVPSHLAALQSGQATDHVMPRRRLIVGGEASRLEWIERLRATAPACEIFNHYGPTETTVGVLTHHVGSSLPRTATGTLPLGMPLPHSTVHVVDGEGREVQPGGEGELLIGGDGVGRGYLHRPELTAERFIPDRFDDRPGRRLYRTGDLVRLLADGTLEFCGRIDDQIKIRGYRVEPGEIAAVLCEHSGVTNAMVLGVDEPAGGKQLVAYVVPAWSPGRPQPNPTEVVTPATLRTHLKSRLPPYMMPSAFVLLDAFPLNANGKVDRRALPPPVVEHATPATASATSLSPTEAALAEIWTSMLNVPAVNVNDSFFDLGGHSLMAMRMMTRIRETFGVEVPLRALFEGPTLSGLANIVDGQTWLAASKASPSGPVRGEEEIAL